MVAQAVAAIALGLLGASGVAKLIDPEPTTGAMAAARLPSSDMISRILAAVEVAVAVAALATGSPPVMLAAAALYAGFAIFTFSALANRIPVQSCGCFGREDTPPNLLHVAYNVVAAIGLAIVGLLDVSPIDWTLPVTELVLYSTFAIIGVYASYLLLSRLPRLLALTRAS